MSRIILLVSMFTLAACATTQDVENLQYNMNLQEKRIEERMESLAKSLSSAEQKLAGQIESASTPVRSTQANLWAEIESLRTQVASVQGNLDELRLQSRQTGTDELRELKERVASLESRLVEMSSRLALDLETRPAPPAGTPQQPVDPAQNLYERGLSSFQAREYAQAQTFFSDFATTYSKHELVPNALFWKGESFFQMKDYGQAILAYQEVIDKFPKSNKIPGALLKQGVSFISLGKDKPGRLLLEDLVKRFPDTAEARRAKDLLK
jgi:tol-pal system protein YbgF